MLEGDGWSLGSNTNGSIRDGRALTDDERLRIPLALNRLASFNGHVLVGPLANALDALSELWQELSATDPYELQHGEFRSRLVGRLSDALAHFTGLRSTVEATARGLELPVGSSAPENFQRLYREHHAYRLVWMLRNIDQHYGRAADSVTISADRDPESGEKRIRPMIDVAALCQRYITESDEQHRRQWRQLRDLWVTQPQRVDVRWSLHEAFRASETVIALFINEAEPLILSDYRYISVLMSEVEPLGSASAIRFERDASNPKRLGIIIRHLDPMILGKAVLALNGARTILGLPPLSDADIASNHPRSSH